MRNNINYLNCMKRKCEQCKNYVSCFKYTIKSKKQDKKKEGKV